MKFRSTELRIDMLRVLAIKLSVALFLLMITWTTYQNALRNSFAFDDHLAITNNADVKDPAGHNIWTNDIWGKELSAVDSHKSYRPLLMVLFRSLWSISSEAQFFRQVSVAAHYVVSYLSFELGLLIWGRFDIAMGSAVLFASHPIHVEAVTAVVNMAEAFSCIFVLLSYFIYIKWSKESFFTLNSFGSVLLWTVFVVIAALFKETGIAACLLVVAHSVLDALHFSVVHFYHLPKVLPSGANISQNVVEPVEIKLDSKIDPSAPVINWWHIVRRSIGCAWACASVYLYMAARALITSTDRPAMLSSWRRLLYSLVLQPVLGPWDGGGAVADSYLQSSQLLRKAENPFAMLKDPVERLLSGMV
jgi:hypothetical protein